MASLIGGNNAAQDTLLIEMTEGQKLLMQNLTSKFLKDFVDMTFPECYKDQDEFKLFLENWAGDNCWKQHYK